MKYKAEAGDTVESFALRYNLTTDRLIELNSTPQPCVLLDGKVGADAVDEGWELEIGGKAVKNDEGAINDEWTNALLPGAESVPEKLAKLKALNPAISDRIQQCYAAKPAFHKKLRDIDFFVIPAEPVAKPKLEIKGDPLPTTDLNAERLCFTYETRCNVPVYRKESKARGLGLYVVPLDERAVVVVSDDFNEVDILRQTFLPDLSGDEVVALSKACSPWLPNPDAKPIPNLNSLPSQDSTRREAIVNLAPRLVMPYNYFANDTDSAAIGTRLQEVQPRDGEGTSFLPYRLKKRLPLWETASRSSVVQLAATTGDELLKASADDWNFRAAKADSAVNGVTKPFDHRTDSDCYSVKSGVCWVGTKFQGTKTATADAPGKDILEEEALVACMRSDWVRKRPADPNLVVLRELLTVIYRNQPSILGKPCQDGFQVRDLRPLLADKLYFPPLAIPCAGKSVVDAFLKKDASDDEFEEFWENHYARAVGRAKAELLLRYGVQMQTPNPQNFLLELDKDTLKPTGKVIIRDLGDLLLHSEIIRAIGGDDPVIKYELDNPDGLDYLPIQTSKRGKPKKPDGDVKEDSRFATYPKDTRTQWHSYSQFAPQYGGSFLPRRFLTNIRWGRAHLAAYIERLNERLQIDELADLTLILEEAARRVKAAGAEPTEIGDSRSRDAKLTLPKVIKQAGETAKSAGHISLVTAETYEALIQDGQCGENSPYNTEWALEAHASEYLHEILVRPETLQKIEAL